MEQSQNYIEFQSQSPSPFHAVQKICSDLDHRGFVELQADADWSFSEKNYYVVHHEKKSVVAFCLADIPPHESGFSLIASHTDSPAFKLRTQGLDFLQGYQRLLTEIHGGIIFRSWLDRPLVLAGALYSIEKNAGKV